MVKPRHHRLQELAAHLSESTDRVKILDLVALEGVIALGAHAGITSLLTEDGMQFQPLRPVPHPEEAPPPANVIDAWKTFAADTPLPIADAVRTQTLIVLESRVERDARYPHLAGREEPTNAWIVSPIVLPARAIGAIELRLLRARSLSDEDRAYVVTLTDLCAQALDRARLAEALHTETQQREHLAATLHIVKEQGRVLQEQFQRLHEQYAQLREEHQRLIRHRTPSDPSAEEAAGRDAWKRTFVRDMLAGATAGGLRLCDGTEELPAPLTPFGEPIDLSLPGGVRDLRHRALAAAKIMGLSDEREYDLEVAAGEVGTNALSHAGGGMAAVSVESDRRIQVRVADQGPGISLEDLPKATLARGYSTRATLGHGFKIVLQTTDHVYLLTSPAGTTVVLEQEKRAEPAW